MKKLFIIIAVCFISITAMSQAFRRLGRPTTVGISDIAFTSDNVRIVCAGDKIYKYEHNGGYFSVIPSVPTGSAIVKIAVDTVHDNILLFGAKIGTYRNSFAYLSKKSDATYSYFPSNAEFSYSVSGYPNQSNITNLRADSTGKIWIGSVKGIVLYNDTTDMSNCVINMMPAMTGAQTTNLYEVTDLCPMPNDNLWCLGDLGVRLYNSSDQTQKSNSEINSVITTSSYAPYNKGVAITSRGEYVWYVNGEAIYKLKYDGSTCEKFPNQYQQYIKCIRVDQAGVLWAITNLPNNANHIVYTPDNGITWYGINMSSGYDVDSDGQQISDMTDLEIDKYGNKWLLANGGSLYMLSDTLTASTAQSTIRAYPNPVNDELTIDVQEPCDIVITSATGQIVYSNSITSTTRINTSDFTRGIYFVSYTTETSRKTIKIIKN